MEGEFLSHKGNYRQLRCFQLAEHLYDITFVFCERFIKPGDRTRDQMIQAARSIKQNIAEGSCAANMSTQSLRNGGIKEQMTKARLDARRVQGSQSGQSARGSQSP